MAKIIETPTLETERLILRPRTLEDSHILQKHFNNWNIIKQLNSNVPWPYPENGSRDHFQNEVLPNIRAGKTMMWCLCEKKNLNYPIGLIEYNLHNNEEGESDRGFWLAEPYWSKGYMSEAITTINNFIFIDLKISKMIVQNYKSNIGSHRVKEKTGATLLKNTKEKWRNEIRDVEVWELTAENWKKFKEDNS